MRSQPTTNDSAPRNSAARVRAIDLRGKAFRPSKTGTLLLQNDAVEVASLRMSRGEQRPLHSVQSEAAIYSVEGYALLHVNDAKYDLTPGVLVCLAAKELHRLEAIEDATVLTIKSRSREPQVGVGQQPAEEIEHAVGAVKANAVEKDIVQEAAEESFPASDPPCWTAGVNDVAKTRNSNDTPLHSLAELQRRQDAPQAEVIHASMSDRTKQDRTQFDDPGESEQIAELMPDEVLAVEASEQKHADTSKQEGNSR